MLISITVCEITQTNIGERYTDIYTNIGEKIVTQFLKLFCNNLDQNCGYISI